jgi:ABC-2 type transport system permease protein
VRAALRAELFKQRSTRSGLGLFCAMLGLVLFVVLLHGLGLGAANFDSTSKQLTVLFGWGEVLGALFAALFGAMAITGEIRYARSDRRSSSPLGAGGSSPRRPG